MGQGGQGREHRVAALPLAEIGFDAPQRHHDLGRHAVAGLDPPQERRVAGEQLAAALDAVGADHAATVLGEGHPALGLTPVGLDHRRDRPHAGERRVEHRSVDPLLPRLAAQLAQPSLKGLSAAAGWARPATPEHHRAWRAPRADRTDRMWLACSPSA